MPVQDTSIEAYKEILGDGTIGYAQEKVLTFLLGGKADDKEIMMNTALSLSSVCGRRNELVEMGLVEDTGTKIGDSGKRVHIWAYVPLSRVKPIIKPLLINCPYCNGKGKVTHPKLKLIEGKENEYRGDKT